MAAYNRLSDMSNRINQLPMELKASQEYYSRAGGSDQYWIERVFNEIVGHSPSRAETDLWMRRLVELRNSRFQLLEQLTMQARG